MTYPEVQFVAAPEDGAEVLFDFNDNIPGEAPAQIVAGSFTLGTPEVIGDPDGLGVQYGPRTVGFSLLIYGNRQAAKETQALLARTFMLRRRGWLRVKLDEFSVPVWLRTYTPTPAELDFSLIAPDADVDAWQLEVEVAAEPFVRGERTTLWSGTINNDPAAATNPMGVALPAVVGDAPAPLRIEATFSRQHNQSDILWSTATVPAGYTPTVWQIGSGDGWGVGLDLQAPETSPDFSASTYRRVTFASDAGLYARLGGPAPSAVAPGRYRVMLRVASTGGSFAFRLGHRTDYNGDDYGASKIVTMDRGATTFFHAAWVDLGEFDFPRHRTLLDFSEVPGVPSIALQVARIAGGSELILDAFKLVPVEMAGVTSVEPWEKVSTLVSEFAGQGPNSGEVQIWDGDAETSLRVSPAGMMDAYVSPSNRGRFPVVRPGVMNFLTLMQQVRAGVGDFLVDGNADAIADSASVVLSYQPRWLWLGDA